MNLYSVSLLAVFRISLNLLCFSSLPPRSYRIYAFRTSSVLGFFFIRTLTTAYPRGPVNCCIAVMRLEIVGPLRPSGGGSIWWSNRDRCACEQEQRSYIERVAKTTTLTTCFFAERSRATKNLNLNKKGIRLGIRVNVYVL